MQEMDFDFLLDDRKQKIAQLYEEHNLAEKGYIAFSGGKDSMILSALVDMAVPGNTLPRVYANTGIEYTQQVNFVRSLVEKDNRIIILPPTKNVKETLDKQGYPFKSKFHSHMMYTLINSGKTDSVTNYFTSDKNAASICPKILRYQYTEPLPFKVSDRCCKEFKKKSFTSYARKSKRSVAITGMRSAEGGKRKNMGCLSYRNGRLKNVNPLVPCPDDWCDEFVKRFDITLSPLYYAPYNFKRTGCRGCPFNRHLQQDLDTLATYNPAELKAAFAIFRPVYTEYLRIGYRLKETPALQLELDL